MPDATAPSTGRSKLEFVLVLIMLVTLSVLVIFILCYKSPFTEIRPGQGTYDEYLREKEAVLNYRKDLLAVVIAAFGAWIGAGAAYFFGRENLRESANSLLQLHRQMTGAEKLSALRVRDISPKPLDANYAETVTLKEATEKVAANPGMWFISVKVGNEWHILNSEALLIYIKKTLDEMAANTANSGKTYKELNDSVLSKTLKDVVPEMLTLDVTKSFVNQFLLVSLDDNAAAINREMDAKGVFLAIIKDKAGDFVQYFTTSDIRKALVNA